METDLQAQRTNLWLRGWGGRVVGRDRLGVWDWHVHTAIFKIDNQQGPTVQHRELCSILSNNLNGKRIYKRIDTCICITSLPLINGPRLSSWLEAIDSVLLLTLWKPRCSVPLKGLYTMLVLLHVPLKCDLPEYSRVSFHSHSSLHPPNHLFFEATQTLGLKCFRLRAGKLCSEGQIQSRVCFCKTLKVRMVFTFLKCCKQNKTK